jgi:hypothetical protein
LAGGWKIRYFLHKKMNMVLFQYRDDTLVERSFRHRRIGIKASMKTHPGDLAFRKGHRRLAEATAAVLLIILQPLAADRPAGTSPSRSRRFIVPAPVSRESFGSGMRNIPAFACNNGAA